MNRLITDTNRRNSDYENSWKTRTAKRLDGFFSVLYLSYIFHIGNVKFFPWHFLYRFSPCTDPKSPLQKIVCPLTRSSGQQQKSWYPNTRHTITKNRVVNVFGRNSISAMPPPKQNNIRPQIRFIACASPFMLLLQSMRRHPQIVLFSVDSFQSNLPGTAEPRRSPLHRSHRRDRRIW